MGAGREGSCRGREGSWMKGELEVRGGDLENRGEEASWKEMGATRNITFEQLRGLIFLLTNNPTIAMVEFLYTDTDT